MVFRDAVVRGYSMGLGQIKQTERDVERRVFRRHLYSWHQNWYENHIHV